MCEMFKNQFARQTLAQLAQDKTSGKTFPDEETSVLAQEGKTKIKTQFLPKTTICKCLCLFFCLVFVFTDCESLCVHLRQPFLPTHRLPGSEEGFAGGRAQLQ